MKPPALPAESEAEFIEKARALLDMCGWRWWHVRTSIGTNPGLPDIIAVHRTVIRPILWIELKTLKGKVSPEQKEGIEILLFQGAEVHVFRPGQEQELADLLGPRPQDR